MLVQLPQDGDATFTISQTASGRIDASIVCPDLQKIARLFNCDGGIEVKEVGHRQGGHRQGVKRGGVGIKLRATGTAMRD